MTSRNHITLAAIAMTALLCAVVFAGYKSMATKTNAEDLLFVKRSSAIACNPDNITNDDRSSRGSNNNGNGCLHQQGALCEINISKRKSLKTENC